MAVRVLLPNAFQKHTNNVREISSDGGESAGTGRRRSKAAFLRCGTICAERTGRFAGLSTSMSMRKIFDSWGTISTVSRKAMRCW